MFERRFALITVTTPSRTTTTGSDHDRVLGRALDLLEALAGAASPLSVNALAAAVGCPKTSVHRLVRSLVRQDLIVHDGRGYAIGNRTRVLAMMISGEEHRWRRGLMPCLVDLYRETGQMVRFGVLQQNDCVYLETVCGRRTAGAVGDECIPAHACAAGKVLLAYRDVALASAAPRRPLTRLTDFTVVDPDRLAEELVAIRMAEFAIVVNEQRLGQLAVARPVLDSDRNPAGAIEVAGDEASFNPKAVARYHRQAVIAASIFLRSHRFA